MTAVRFIVLSLLVGSQGTQVRTIADVGSDELSGWVQALGRVDTKATLLVDYSTCQSDVVNDRRLDIALPLVMTWSLQGRDLAAAVDNGAVRLTLVTLQVKATFPDAATDHKSTTGKLNLAEARELMPRLNGQFEALASHYMAGPVPDDVLAALKRQLSDTLSTTLAKHLGVVPDIHVDSAEYALPASPVPDVALCEDTKLFAQTIPATAMPSSDGARGAFLFATSAVKPRNLQYLKDDAGNVLAYRPAEQTREVDVVRISVSNDTVDEASMEEDRGNKIVGGDPVTPGEMDWSVAFVTVKADGQKGNFCGGTVIAPSWVVTAAHCRITSNSTVILVRKEINGNDGHERKVKTVWRHIDFGKTAIYDADIALVELTEMTDAPTVSLQTTPIDASEWVRAVGWGAPAFGSRSVEMMREVELKTVRNSDCRAFYRNQTNKVTVNMICAREKNADACQGDSGSGLFYEYSPDKFRLAGIVSFGKSCALAMFPGVYTNTTQYLDWISKVQTAKNIVEEL